MGDNGLTYKGINLRRDGSISYYGDPSDKFIVKLEVLDFEKEKDVNLSKRVSVELLNTDPRVSVKEKIVKKSEKDGYFQALDLGAAWLSRELKKSAE
jgi:hypothetical protein